MIFNRVYENWGTVYTLITPHGDLFFDHPPGGGVIRGWGLIRGEGVIFRCFFWENVEFFVDYLEFLVKISEIFFKKLSFFDISLKMSVKISLFTKKGGGII